VSRRFDEASEERLRERYIVSQEPACPYRVARACAIFREAFPGDSLLDHTHTTKWARRWNVHARMVSTTRASYLSSLHGWWDWLFEQHIIEDNVLAFVSCVELAADATAPLTLRCNLHRHAVEYLQRFSIRSRQSYSVFLKRFNIFINRLPEVPSKREGKIDLREDVVAAWFRHVGDHYGRSGLDDSVGPLSRFLDALVEKGVLVDNPVERLRRRFPMRGRRGIARALTSARRGAALQALERGPVFTSALAEHIAGFLALKRAIGYRYRHQQYVLRDLDRFLAGRDERGPITYDLLAEWRALRAHLHPGTRALRWTVVRQLCVYLRRYVPETYVPDPLLGRGRRAPLKAQIVEPRAMKTLLEAVNDVVPGTRSPLLPRTCRTLLILIYTTGLRIGEVRGLRLHDVDLRQRVLTIRNTKFGKSRLVPFSNGLLPILRDYHRERLRLFGEPAPDAPFFVGQFGGSLGYTSINTIWRQLRRHAGLGGDGPRIHDLRHSFATLRLAAWYREGADVQAKLPLLSTYLGHVSPASTQRYLTILPETKLAASERFRRYGGALVARAGEGRARA
jgi:integrase/recombinase XerD